MSDWNKKIIAEFRANEGRVGGPFEGAPMVLVHHIGARSGTERVTPLRYFPEGRDLVVVGSAAGAQKNPDWYHNLLAHPRVDVEVGSETFPVEATEADPTRRERLWARIVAEAPGFGEYQEKTTRTIPVLTLTRV